MKHKIYFLLVVFFAVFSMGASECCKEPPIFANLSGTITDEVSGNPIEGVTVEIASKSATSGADGKYSFFELPLGNFEINITKTGYKPIDNKAVALIAGENTQSFKLQQILSISPQTLTFQNSESEKTLQLTYVGSGTISFSIVTSENWLTVTPTDGSVSNQILFIKVKVNRAGLAYGTFTGTLAINSQNINPLQVSVTMIYSEPAKLATVTTTNVSGITTNSAISGGNVSNDGGATVTQRGICWGTATNPTIGNNASSDGTSTGTYTSQITGLAMNTTYFVRAFATNSVGTAYGSEMSFTTPSTSMPSVTTSSPTNTSANSATAGGNVTSDGGLAVTARGVCWATNENPTTAGTHSTEGTGTGNFTSQITGLASSTT